MLVQLLQAEIAAVLTYTAAVARRMELGISEIAALEHLQGEGELTPTQLGARLYMTSGAVTALVDRLERAGYVERWPNPADRRSSILRVTERGSQRAMRHLGPLALDIREIAESLPEGDREVVGRYLEAVTAAVSHHALGERSHRSG